MSGVARAVYKSGLGRRVPRGMRSSAAMAYDRLRLAIESRTDAKRYRRFAARPDSAFTPKVSGSCLETQLVKDYHRVEKGLTLAEPRRPFGTEVRQRLVELIPVGERGGDAAIDEAVQFARDAVSALDLWNSTGDVDPAIAPAAPAVANFDTAVLEDFFQSRHSLRNYDPNRPVTDDLLVQAAEWAARTPSVCNRQSGRIHVYRDPQAIAKLLRLQEGNAGFGGSVATLVAFTVDSRLFAGSAERNQRWIDGALYAMTFTWALHGLGVQSCMLNWSKANSVSAAARKAGSIPDYEDIICLMAIGYPPEGDVRFARSPRNAVERYMTIHQ